MFKIMMIDNDPTSLAIGRAVLETEYQLTLARSGLLAFGVLKNEGLPDLILSELFMPGFDGIEFLRTLKADEQYTDIPVVFLSNESSTAKYVECYREGAADFIEKPADPDILKFKIQRQLSFLEIRRENQRLKKGIGSLHEQLDQLLSPI